MKFYLAKHEHLNLHYGHLLQSEKGHRVVRRVVIPVTVTPSGSSEEEILFCEKIQTKFSEIENGNNNKLVDGIIQPVHNCSQQKELILSMAVVGGTLTGFLGIADGFGNILEKLHKIFGDVNLKLEVVVDNFRDMRHASSAKHFTIFTKQLNVSHRKSLNIHTSDDAKFQFNDPGLVLKFKDETSQLGGSISIIASVDTSATKCNSCLEKFQVYKRMLQQEICCDAVILAKDGIPVKCHKALLSAQSSVLKALFKTDMEDGNNGIVEMPDMSEQSVRAFLAYLYHWEQASAVEESSQVAFDLFHAGHKYDIPSLEKAMGNVLLCKDNQWFDVEVALKLFLFARNLPTSSGEGDGENRNSHKLKMKAVKVLKLNFSTLEKSPSYEQLFQDEPKAAMELSKFAFFSYP